ncbi:MAG: antibiotic biosynthesis monooxygenase [Fibrobacterales bacterium]
MITVNVYVHVKESYLKEFIEATIENASQSNKEPGIARFDLIQEIEDPQKFMLVEVYRDSDAPAAHKETAHYKKWREIVEPMMDTPRKNNIYQTIYVKDTDYAL